MGLVINILPAAKHGEINQKFTLEHKGEKIHMTFFKKRNNYKIDFDNPNFRVTWQIEELTTSTRDEDRSPDSE